MSATGELTWGDIGVTMMPVGAIGTNCVLVRSISSKRGVIIDPGADPDAIDTAITEIDFDPEAILVTHGHWDHLGGIAELARRHELPVHAPRIEAIVLENLADYGPEEYGPWEGHSPEHMIDGGETIEVAGLSFDVMFVPGHSPGSMAFVLEQEDEPTLVISGDVLFQGSVGRVDLPFASGPTLMQSLAGMLRRFNDETIIFPGHGSATTIGEERGHNPFLQDVMGTATGTTAGDAS